MKALLIAAALFAVFSTAAASASAQATRVDFQHGKTSAILTGVLHNYEGKRVYLVRVRAGQKMKVEGLGNHAVSIWIEGPPGYEQDLAADCHGMTYIDPTLAGDYKLTVQECQKADPWRGSFRVRVSVR